MRVSSAPRFSSLCIAALATVSAALVGLSSVNAQTVTRASASLTSIDRLALVRSLAHYGRESKDPLALITAARLRSSIATQNRDSKSREEVAGNGPPASSLALLAPSLSRDGLLADARTYAGGDRVLLAMIDETTASAPKGRVGVRPASSIKGSVRGGATELMLLNFYRGQKAEIFLATEGLELTVQDEKGRSVCAEAATDQRGLCSWTPRSNGPFYIRIKNPSKAGSAFELFTN
jgi:hypothetical protein